LFLELRLQVERVQQLKQELKVLQRQGQLKLGLLGQGGKQEHLEKIEVAVSAHLEAWEQP
ncbi:hypothetical protein U1Q18_014126, partial [Sarracenia purpurea var. burkii]